MLLTNTERARVVARIAPSASKRIALVPHWRVAARLCTGSRATARPRARVNDDCRMPHALALALAALIALAPPWGWPVDAPYDIVRPYLAPATAFSAGHRGVDLAAPSGAVYAPADGVVHFAGTVVDRPLLSIEHPGGVLSSYEPVTTTLRRGDPVQRGQPIGAVEPGHCASPCLHFGVRVNGQYRSPLAWLGGGEPAVLLPSRAAPTSPRGRARTDRSVPASGRRCNPQPSRAARAHRAPERARIRQRATTPADNLDRTDSLSTPARRAGAPVGSSP